LRSLLSQLGGNFPSGRIELRLFVPSVDRDGVPIDQEYCRDEALRVLGRLFGGATALPPGRGVWRDDERGGELVFDETVTIHCWADPADATDAAMRDLRRFLCRMGRETRQGAVLLAVDDGGVKSYWSLTERDWVSE
jgi:hypothetical protein